MSSKPPNASARTSAARRCCRSITSEDEKPPVMPLWNTHGSGLAGRLFRNHAVAIVSRSLTARCGCVEATSARFSVSGASFGTSPSIARAKRAMSSGVDRIAPTPPKRGGKSHAAVSRPNEVCPVISRRLSDTTVSFMPSGASTRSVSSAS